eukprot:3406658-Rhodomonas_salina.2
MYGCAAEKKKAPPMPAAINFLTGGNGNAFFAAVSSRSVFLPVLLALRLCLQMPDSLMSRPSCSI